MAGSKPVKLMTMTHFIVTNN